MGLLLFRGYGLSMDENQQRDIGMISLKYVAQKISPAWVASDGNFDKYQVPLPEFYDRDYGVAFETPVCYAERLIGFDDDGNKFLFRHLCTFLVCFGGLIAVYQLANRRFRDWRLGRSANGRWATRVTAKDFGLDLSFQPTQPPLPQGRGGYSRKGARPDEASYYYSVPHLRVTGQVTRAGKTVPVTGEAWLDREWSSDYLAPAAQGWDWTGLNFDDGSALMAFRIRRKGGGTVWAGGSLRRPDGRMTVFAPGDVAFRTLATWRSKATGAVYPVSQELSVRAEGRVQRWRLVPMFAAQELDTRRSGMPVYWEGAVRTRGGRGYLELTGYDRALKM